MKKASLPFLVCFCQGLARQHQSTTVVTAVVGAGTLPYMAPELLEARTGGLHEHITNRVDVYRSGLPYRNSCNARTSPTCRGLSSGKVATVPRETICSRAAWA
jgi:hypothetical protein